jgi:uncharacterized membrane protein
MFRVLVMLFIAAVPLVTHFVLTSGEWQVTAYALILSQMGLAIWVVLGRFKCPYRTAIVFALLACSSLTLALHVHGILVLSAGVPHALAHSALLLVFGMSLLPGRTPIITVMSHVVHGPLPAAIDRYTRTVTWVWCFFFALQLLGSALLMAFAPVAYWSTFVNVLNAPLVAALFLGEKLTRHLWVADPPRETLSDMLPLVALMKSDQASRDPQPS